MDPIALIVIFVTVFLMVFLLFKREQKKSDQEDQKRISENKYIKKGESVNVHMHSSRFVESNKLKCIVEEIDEDGRVRVSKWFNPGDIYRINDGEKNDV